MQLVQTLTRKGILTPFPIQAAAMPDALAGKDVLGRGQTGSGKTLAFGLPMLTRLAGSHAKPRQPRGLVLVPTRELAMQVQDSLTDYADALGLSCRMVVGGTSFPKQISALRRGVDLLIATPGRLADHVRQGTADLSEVTVTALDEADQMADMGFLPQVRELLDLVDPNGQRLLFSATLDGDVDKLVRQYLKNPVTHSTAPSSASVTTMDHHVLLISAEDKNTIVAEVGAREGRTIMFVRTKHTVDRLTKKLRSLGVRAGALHGGKTQGARTRTLAEFREGIAPVLVATDVAARGIHVDNVSLVLHVDPPADPKDYLHRAGRTARAGESGTVVTLVLHNQRRSVQAMTGKAGVSPVTTKVRPGDQALIELTGAREPSGVAIPDEPERPQGRRKFGDRPERGEGGGYRGRSSWNDRGQGGRPNRFKPSTDERGGASRRDFTDARREGGESRFEANRGADNRSQERGEYRGNGGGYRSAEGYRGGDNYRRNDDHRGPRQGGYRDGAARDAAPRDGAARDTREGGYRENRSYGNRYPENRSGGSYGENRSSYGENRGTGERTGGYRGGDNRYRSDNRAGGESRYDNTRSESRHSTGGSGGGDSRYRTENRSGGDNRRAGGEGWRGEGRPSANRGGWQPRRHTGGAARRPSAGR
ncbi:DEAD/DEAH box helicase [Crossiella sp. SN42]|uniref:DEAD/DEAH box helicase n=1 Tax=Crossiella sp. SN42 TaxID=2944808 RepID=UPI0027E1006E|nr:DEAD/DEAH box helicase [Crossiella sp. SN42]